MNFLNFRKVGSTASNGTHIGDTLLQDNAALPDIPENIFIENSETERKVPVTKEEKSDNNIDLLFRFLDRNLESQGYDDALRNPDITNMKENIASIKNDLQRTIKKVKTFYEGFIREIIFHIESRSRSGMVDTVQELQMKKQIAEDHMQKVLEIDDDTKNDRGDSQGLILSYTRGFKNGLAAISHHNIIRKNL